MLFHSIEYLLLFVIVYLAYWRLPLRYQNWLLLIASYVFYGWWNPSFCLLILFSSLVDYVAARKIEAARNHKRTRKRWLLLSVVVNLSVLGTFKYLGFFVESTTSLLNGLGFHVSEVFLKLTLPVGISFYTFQSMAYTIDVYRGEQRAVRSLRDLFLYVAFFPQLVAGPIERPRNLMPQLQSERVWDPALARRGAEMVLWGFLLKVVVADNLAVEADRVFIAPAGVSPWEILSAMYLFSIQIFGDFAGYSLMAMGFAALLGIRLSLNFRYPYFASDIRDFWRRWHITLSSWFRDYLYIPLGGGRGGFRTRMRNALIVCTLCGLWHGAAWTFVLWGALHGLLIGFQRFRPGQGPFSQSRIGLIVRVVITFHIVSMLLVVFRSDDIWSSIVAISHLPAALWTAPLRPLPWFEFAIIGLLIFVQFIQRKKEFVLDIADQPLWKRNFWCALCIAIIVVFGVTSPERFIYFQF